MKATHSQVTEKSAVRFIRDSAKVQIGAMAPSFPPAQLPLRRYSSAAKTQAVTATSKFAVESCCDLRLD